MALTQEDYHVTLTSNGGLGSEVQVTIETTNEIEEGKI
jgi:hypothetical protein